MSNERSLKEIESENSARLEKIADKWNKKRNREINSTRIVRVKTPQSEIKKVNEWTKHKEVGPDHDKKWNEKTPKMYFVGYSRPAVAI